jgi:transposase
MFRSYDARHGQSSRASVGCQRVRSRDPPGDGPGAGTSALTLVIEIGDFGRFARGDDLAAFVGLVPSEHSSGERRRQGSITKAGNTHVRRVLVEAAWHARRRPNTGPALRKRLVGQPPEVLAIATKAQARLHARYWRLVERRKPTTVAATAVARELVGFCWALMRLPA